MKRNLFKLLAIILSITMLVTFSLTGCSEQGPEGPQGEQGIQGEKGDKGDTGAQGEKGDKGDTGAQGEKGDKGDTGAQGEKGDKGETGAQGEKGDKGDTGAQGEKGDKGETGVQGEKGDKGEKGDTGAAGADGKTPYIKDGNWWIGDTDTGIKAEGVDGAQGEKGDKGDTGAQGEKGDKGDTGAQGEKGDKGDTGAQGEKGDKGDTGAQGEKGDKGETGAQGEKGDKGETGVGVQGARIEDKNGKLYLILILTDGTEVEAGYVGVAYYTVTFVDYDGTVLKTEEVEYKKGAEAPKDPEREGYAFDEWDKAFDNITGPLTVTAKYVIGLDYQLNAEETGYVICGIGSFDGSELVIPSTFRGLPVTEIGAAAFEKANITSVTIPDGVTSIGMNAFNNCRNLISVTIPGSVEYIGDRAFLNCSKLIEVQNLSELTIIIKETANGYAGYYALNIYKSDDGTKLHTDSNGYVFYKDGDTCYLMGYTGSETALTLPESSNEKGYEIYKYAFYGNTEITSVIIPSGVTKIGGYAFHGCTSLTSVTIPDGVTTIGDYAFNGCTKLANVTLGNKVTSIGMNAFYGCTSLTSVTIPDGVTEIGDNAFRGCTKLANVTLGNKVTSIGMNAFDGCRNLISVTIPGSVEYIGDKAFRNCHKLIEVKNLSTLTITNETANGHAGYYALNIYTSDDGTKLHTDRNGYIFYEDGDTCYLMGYTGSETALTLPESSNEKGYKIYKYAFYGNTEITSVIIPDGVTSIGNYAFSGCTSLTSVTIPKSVTSIGMYAFRNCNRLTTINFSGTEDEWNNISKGKNWDLDTGSYVLNCAG